MKRNITKQLAVHDLPHNQ